MTWLRRSGTLTYGVSRGSLLTEPVTMERFTWHRNDDPGASPRAWEVYWRGRDEACARRVAVVTPWFRFSFVPGRLRADTCDRCIAEHQAFADEWPGETTDDLDVATARAEAYLW